MKATGIASNRLGLQRLQISLSPAKLTEYWSDP
jgi:hypothetical protein